MTLSVAFRGRVVIAVAALATWWVTVDSPFAEDDYLFLEAVQTADASTLAGYLVGEGVMDHHHRPLSDPYFFALVEHGLGGRVAFAHALLILFHVLSGWCVVALGRRLTGSVGAGIVAGLVYVTRDFAFPSMSWASGFSDIGSACFALGACVWLLRWWESGRSADRWWSIVAALAALLTKETAVVLLGLFVWLALWVRAERVARVERVRSLWPLFVVVLPIAAWQFTAARFSEDVGQKLYELELGRHAFIVWPAYLSWCVVAVKEWFENPVVRGVASGASIALIALALWSWRRRPHAMPPMGVVALGWFTIAIAPALLAPNRVLTNYVALAAAGPCIWIAAAIETGWSRRGVERLWSAFALATLLVVGTVTVFAKERGRFASGGWINPAKAERLDHALDTVAGWPDFEPPTNARVLVFGGLALDVRVFGDPRRLGFGPQQVVASALRVRLDRADLDVLSLPDARSSPPWVFEQLTTWIREDPAHVVVLDVTGRTRDRTAEVTRLVSNGGGPEAVRRFLLGS